MSHGELNLILVAGTIMVIAVMVIGFIAFVRWGKKEEAARREFQDQHRK